MDDGECWCCVTVCSPADTFPPTTLSWDGSALNLIIQPAFLLCLFGVSWSNCDSFFSLWMVIRLLAVAIYLPYNGPNTQQWVLTISASPTYRKSPAVMAAIHCWVAMSVATDRAMYRPTNEVMALPTFKSSALRTETPLWSKMAKSPVEKREWQDDI